MNLKDLSGNEKKLLLKALAKGTITKKDLKSNPEMIKLLNPTTSLLHLTMGKIESFSFDGEKITKEEFERVSLLSVALGYKEKNVTLNMEVIKSPYYIPLASSESEIIL